MIGDYTNDSSLFNSCLTLLDESFPGCKEFALNGMKYNAFWNKAWTPFILKDNQLLSSRIQLSKQFSIINDDASALFILNMMNKKIHYSAKLKVLIVCEIIDKTLYLKEIISEKQTQISDVIRLILGYEKTQIDKIVMQFCPDRFLDEKDYSPVLARPEQCVMTSDTFLFDSKYFRYPELYWC